MFYVYIYYDPDTMQPFYVGKGTGSRSTAHLCPSNLTGNTAKQNKIKKLLKQGKQPVIETYVDGVDETTALATEVQLIKQWGRADNGTGILLNHTDGGEGVSGIYVSPEHREYYDTVASERMRQRNLTDNPAKRPDVRAKISARATGRIGTMTGKKHTEETRLRLSNLAKNREKKKCEFCGKLTSPSNYARVHGTNCASNPDVDPVVLAERQEITRKKQELCNKEQLTCPHCKKTVRKSSYNRYHRDKCKMKNQTTLVEFK